MAQVAESSASTVVLKVGKTNKKKETELVDGMNKKGFV